MSTTAWKGSLNLSLISIPVKLYVAARDERISMNNLHAKCHTKIKMPRSCPTCNREVKNDEIVKAWEFAKGQFVTVTEDEIAAIAPTSDHIMDIAETVKLSEIDPVFFGDSYYIVPEPAGAKAYTLLTRALRDSGRAAPGRMSRNHREMVVVIRPKGRGLACHAMYYSDEVRSVAEFDLIQESAVTPQELKLAGKLLASLEGPFQPEKYHDGYQARLTDMLDKKRKGETITATPAPTPQAPAIDMLAALEASLEAATKQQRPRVQ